MMFARHDLVWLTQEGWETVRRHALPGQLPAIDHWSRAEWPATVRRQDADILADQLCLGITPPYDQPGAPRLRIGLRCLQSHVQRVSRPLGLHEVDTAVPAQWNSDWRAFRAAVAAERLDIRVYGSLAMQTLTGQTYLTEQSDIDLLFTPCSLKKLKAGCDLLAHCSKTLPLDGEVVFPSGRAVAWKEWCQATSSSELGRARRVLVKRLDSVCLRTADELLAEIEGMPCMH